jgi:hypothetical protein
MMQTYCTPVAMLIPAKDDAEGEIQSNNTFLKIRLIVSKVETRA